MVQPRCSTTHKSAFPECGPHPLSLLFQIACPLTHIQVSDLHPQYRSLPEALSQAGPPQLWGPGGQGHSRTLGSADVLKLIKRMPAGAGSFPRHQPAFRVTEATAQALRQGPPVCTPPEPWQEGPSGPLAHPDPTICILPARLGYLATAGAPLGHSCRAAWCQSNAR